MQSGRDHRQNMEVEKFINGNNTTDHGEEQNDNKEDHDHDQDQDHQVDLPGFRFHPTDEELVGFYLKRKVEKKLIRIELIKHIDVYKYDPWDLPRVSNVGDKEWYFFCIRGRKYKNSIRPNRVTGSGFWKATGIDKPIHSVKEPHDCIGLKKSLVYYRGSAGKGTKTDWMMHEFRLPPNDGKTTAAATTAADFPSFKEHVVNAQEAEVWTLCRIFKRIPSYKRYVPTDDNVQNLKGNTTPRKSSSSSISMVDDTSSKTCSLETDYNDPNYYASLELDSDHRHHNRNAQFPQRNRRSSSSSAKPVISSDQQHSEDRDREYQMSRGSWFHLGHLYNNNNFVDIPLAAARQQYHQGPIFPGSYPSFNINPNTADHDFFTNGSWDELRSVVQLAVDHHPSQIYDVTDKS